MNKRAISIILMLAMLFALAVPAAADGVSASATSQTVTVNGEAVAVEAYSIEGSNYFKLRDVAMLLNGTGAQFSVDYGVVTGRVSVETGEAYTAVGGELSAGTGEAAACQESSWSLYVNGCVQSVSTYIINDNNFLSLRDLGALLGFGVNYDEETNTAEITANNDRLPFADASVTVLTPKLDGEYVNVTMYEDTYCSDPSRPQDQRISISSPKMQRPTRRLCFMSATPAGCPMPTKTGIRCSAMATVRP